MARYRCTIKSIEFYNHDTRQVLLELPEGADGSFKAGQYLELILPIKNCPFSIASAPDRTDAIELHIRPTPGSDDSEMIEQLLNSGDTSVEIEFPRGDCFIDAPPDNPVILLAASTGITQMKSMIEHLFASGATNPIHLYWGVVSDADLYFDAQLKDWQAEHSNFHYVPVVSDPATSPDWQGRIGLVGNIALEDFDDVSDVTVVVGGSPAMVYATLDMFVDRGMPETNMRSDVFAYAPRPAKTS